MTLITRTLWPAAAAAALFLAACTRPAPTPPPDRSGTVQRADQAHEELKAEEGRLRGRPAP
ncbi:hypothetical protein HCU62_01705 [Dissulfurirhabdus thermomarina]|uniref:hypothetical protein n=1 Tax=Dissulfurirhabdus thermomarina TaxID=1765737 RepID=UPI00146FFF8F|nr:hypothetical protein [Dissulfurirhabdus thermomarina]NMX22662.1 hypothetical protein [Dissulfurirhabdus thermomarina]